VPAGRSEETYVDSPAPQTDEPSGNPPGWPRISDYWPDAPQRLGPPADHYELPGVDATRTGPALHTRPSPGSTATTWIGTPPSRTGRDLRPALFLAAVTLLVGGGVFAVVSYARSDGDTTTTLPAPTLPAPIVAGSPAATPPVSVGASPSPSPAATPGSAAAPGAGGRTTAPPMIPDAATLEIADGVTQLRIATGNVTNGFFKVGVGEDSTIRAKAVFDDGTVEVTATPNGRKNGTARLEVLLSDDVRWSLRMRGGVSEAAIDLSGADVGDIELIGGAATVDLSVPDQHDAIPIVERGGIGTWRIVTDGRQPVRASFRAGAGSVTLYGDTDAGVDKGATLRDGRGDDGIRVDSEGGVGALTVQSR
jgi:hypothetical protein